MTKKNVKSIIKTLEMVKKRKGMYFQPVTPESLVNFLCGLRVAFFSGFHFWECLKKRGWKKSCVGPLPEMRKKGLSEEAIMNELIDAQIDAFNEQLKIMDELKELKKKCGDTCKKSS